MAGRVLNQSLLFLFQYDDDDDDDDNNDKYYNVDNVGSGYNYN